MWDFKWDFFPVFFCLLLTCQYSVPVLFCLICFIALANGFNIGKTRIKYFSYKLIFIFYFFFNVFVVYGAGFSKGSQCIFFN